MYLPWNIVLLRKHVDERQYGGLTIVATSFGIGMSSLYLVFAILEVTSIGATLSSNGWALVGATLIQLFGTLSWAFPLLLRTPAAFKRINSDSMNQEIS